MRATILIAAIVGISLAGASAAKADVWVNGYTKRNGTVVAPYVRSNPDRIQENNYSYPGNSNPYTGRVAPNTGGYGTTVPVVPMYQAPGYRPYGVPHR
jgi:hypothetical protein